MKHSHVNDTLLYICISRKFAQEHDFKILPKHPLAEENFTIYDYNEGLSKIDWDTMMEVGNYSKEAKNIKLAEVLCSDKINQKLAELTPAIRQSLNFVNSIEHDKMLEGVATVTYLFEQTKELTAEQVIVQFKDWSVDKAKRFSDKEITGYIEYLEGQEMLEKNIFHKYKLIQFCNNGFAAT